MARVTTTRLRVTLPRRREKRLFLAGGAVPKPAERRPRPPPPFWYCEWGNVTPTPGNCAACRAATMSIPGLLGILSGFIAVRRVFGGINLSLYYNRFKIMMLTFYLA